MGCLAPLGQWNKVFVRKLWGKRSRYFSFVPIAKKWGRSKIGTWFFNSNLSRGSARLWNGRTPFPLWVEYSSMAVVLIPAVKLAAKRVKY